MLWYTNMSWKCLSVKNVTVKLRTSLRRYAPDTDGLLSLTLEDSATVSDLLHALGLILGEIGLILIDGQIAQPEQDIPSSATVELFPIFGGG